MASKKNLSIAVVYGYSNWDLDLRNPNPTTPQSTQLPEGWKIQSFGSTDFDGYPNGGFFFYDPEAVRQVDVIILSKQIESMRRKTIRTIEKIRRVLTYTNWQSVHDAGHSVLKWEHFIPPSRKNSADELFLKVRLLMDQSEAIRIADGLKGSMNYFRYTVRSYEKAAEQIRSRIVL